MSHVDSNEISESTFGRSLETGMQSPWLSRLCESCDDLQEEPIYRISYRNPSHIGSVALHDKLDDFLAVVAC